MRRGMRGRPFAARGFLAVALAALLGHVCALEIASAHGSVGHAPAAAEGASHPHSGNDVPHVHTASCDGIRPTSTGFLLSLPDSGPMTTVRVTRSGSYLPREASSLPVSPAQLFILHASLRI
jgi:hypothetical protein